MPRRPARSPSWATAGAAPWPGSRQHGSAGLAAAIPYYGGGIPNFTDEKPNCPVLCHFGEQDKSPSPAQARALLAKHPEVAAHFYDAGHGFNCDQRGSYNAEASKLARSRTVAFLAQHVG